MSDSSGRLGTFEAELRRENLKVLYWTAWVFNPVYLAWIGFDYLLAPAYWGWFALLRIGVAALCTGLAVWCTRPGNHRFVHHAYWAFIVVFAAGLWPMLVMVDTHFLAYVLGFTLVLFGAGLVPLWRPIWTATSTLTAVVGAGLALSLAPPVGGERDLLSATFFVLSAVVISIVMNGAKYNLLRRQYLTQLELKEAQLVSRELRAAEQLKDDFLANVSHELKTPLNAIIGLSESLLDASNPAARARIDDSLSTIAASGRRLALLVEDVLDLSKVKHRELQLFPRPIDAAAVIDLVLTLLAPLAAKKGLELRREVPPGLPAAYADQDRLEQILVNLVGNGIKFTEKGFVEVQARETQGRIEISVVDSGLGIPREQHEAIFGRFNQLDTSATRGQRGTGLGLAISRELVQLHGGELKVESEPGRGSRFTFSVAATEALPERPASLSPERARLSEQEAAPMPAPDPSLEVGSPGAADILVVDDEPANLQVAGNHLTSAGYRVRFAQSGAQALEEIQRQLPDLVLLDVMMPKMSGIDVLKKLRERYDASALPVIILTAKTRVTDLVVGLDAGANDYIAKPISRGELLSRLKTHLHLAKIFTAYGRFVPKQFIEQLGHDTILELELGEHVRKEMSVLFSDIRRFTELSEVMNPEETFKFVNSFLGRVAPAIAQNGGFIDQYIGDALMALFPKGVEGAVCAAADLRRALREYNQHRQASGYRPIELGTGLHVGPLILGTIGYEQRMQTTVIADSVNLASRLEGLTKLFGVPIILSESVVQRMAPSLEPRVRSLGRMRVKGRKRPVAVYELIDGAPEQERQLRLATLQDFEGAVKSLFSQDYAEAQALLDNVLRVDPEDPAAAKLLERARDLEGSPGFAEGEGDLLDRRA